MWITFCPTLSTKLFTFLAFHAQNKACKTQQLRIVNSQSLDQVQNFKSGHRSRSLLLEKFCSFVYYTNGFGRAENRFRREPEEESPNTKGRDAA